MTEPPGLPSALGIEAVEWLGEGAESLTVRVSGRWRRRRPTWSGQAMLVIEAEGTRHRYPAMPEPPSLTGAAPGTWQMSFAVPASVASRAGSRAWIQLGSVVVPLPVPVTAEASEPADEETLGLRRIRSAELAAEAAARRVIEVQAEARALEARIDELEVELAQAAVLARERARGLRTAEQRAHSEQALRQELEERVASLEATGFADGDERDLRIAELELELERLRRSVDEAEQATRAALTARQRAERRVEELRARPRTDARRLDAELVVARAAAPAPPPRGPAGPTGTDGLLWLEREHRLIAGRAAGKATDQTLAALREELARGAKSEAELRGAVSELRAARGTAPPEADAALSSTLAELRAELSGLRAALGAEATEREQAEQRVARAYVAVQEVRDWLAQIRGVDLELPGDPPDPSGTVEAERLSAALVRLRESARQPDAELVPASREWLPQALRALARTDPDGAALVLAVLLPAPATDARVAARLLAAGRLRRRLRRGAARLRGRRRVADSLARLLRTPVRMGELRIDARSALLLAAAMIDPDWSRQERFTIAYDSGPYLHVRGADRPLVSDATLGAVATKIVCGSQLLPAVLTGERPSGTVIVGDPEPLELVRAWLERAQSG